MPPQRDPRDTVERLHERYWEVREAFDAGVWVYPGFLIVEY